MTTGLTWSIEKRDGATHLQLTGEITEDSDFAALLGGEGVELMELVIDLSKVRRINSCGVREWINFVNAVAAKGQNLVLERCSVPIVQQLNVIGNFRGKAKVRSIYAPYFCAACREDHVELLSLESDKVALEENLPCPKCGASMEFDDLPDEYLAFRQ